MELDNNKAMPQLIQVVSDLHTEFHAEKQKFDFLKPTAPILALLGDIGCCGSDDDFEVFKRFILEILGKYEKIIFVPGNHEYYFNPEKPTPPTEANTMDAIDKRIKTFFKQTDPEKLIFLSNSSTTIQTKRHTYCIIGSTLWSYIWEEQYKFIQENMSDYSYIYVMDGKKPRKITPADISNLNIKNVKYIKSQIKKAGELGQKAIVLTHHKPYYSDKYNSSPILQAYENDLSMLFKPPLQLWAYGHTHLADKSVIQGVTFYSNPKGYPRQKTKFDAKATISLA